MASHGLSGLFTAVELASDGIVVADSIGTIQFVNAAFTRMTGFRKEEAIGQNLKTFGG